MSVTARQTAAERHWTCSRRLRERRLRLGLTQADVVTRLDGRGLPLTNRAVSTMENGHGLALGWLPDLAIALDCTVTYLLGLTDDPHRWEPDPPDPREPSVLPPASRSAAPSDRAGTPPDAVRGGVPPLAHHNWILGPVPSKDR